MNLKICKILEDKDIVFFWADEVWDSPHTWSQAGDCGCSNKLSSVKVPRRRAGDQLNANIIHEVAHLEYWRWFGKPPSKQNEVAVCTLALAIAVNYRLSDGTVEYLETELAEQTTNV